LRPEPGRGDLEDRADVVVEPPHEPRIDDVGDPVPVEVPSDLVEMRRRLAGQMVEELRRAREEALIRLDLAVEDA